MPIFLHRPEDFEGKTLRDKIALFKKIWVENYMPEAGSWNSLRLPDVYKVLGWTSIGGSQFRMLRPILEEAGFVLEKMTDPDIGVPVWYVKLYNNGVIENGQGTSPQID